MFAGVMYMWARNSSQPINEVTPGHTACSWTFFQVGKFHVSWINSRLFHHHQSLHRVGRWGTTDDFATSFLHFSLFSTALWDLPNSRPVHSLTLSSHLFLCPPCLELLSSSNLTWWCLFHLSKWVELLVSWQEVSFQTDQQVGAESQLVGALSPVNHRGLHQN